MFLGWIVTPSGVLEIDLTAVIRAASFVYSVIIPSRYPHAGIYSVINGDISIHKC